MKTTVVCGLLGSGKTTFIRNFARRTKERTVVLVNDFGQAGIDGEVFSADGITSVELPSGCVCCTLKFDLITTIQRIVKQFSPGHLLIEPSGVASPSGVLEALASAGISSATVIGVVDAVEFLELYESGTYGSFFEDQISNADVLLVNKADLATTDQLEATERAVAGINPRALLFRTVNAVITHPLPLGERAGVRGDVAGVRGAHFHFETHSVLIIGRPAFAAMASLIRALAQGAYGSVARAKALVQTEEGPYRFDVVYGKISTAKFEKDIVNSRLVVIGERLDGTAIRGVVSGG